MSSPIYFFPSTRVSAVLPQGRLSHAFTAGRGVAAAFDGCATDDVSCFEINNAGPGGRSGTLLTKVDEPVQVRLGFFPDRQSWHEQPAGADCWVGLDKEYPPTPAELAKSARPAGHDVELGDGRVWKVPIIRSPLGRDNPGRSQLARDFTYDASGQLNSVRQPAGDALWELSGIAWDHVFSQAEHPTVEMETMVELILGALALNYRLGKPEQQILRLVNSLNWQDAIRALLDWPLIDELGLVQKKTEEEPPAADSSSVSPGAAG